MRRLIPTALIILLAANAGALPFDTVMSGGRSSGMGNLQSTLSIGSDAVLGNPALLADMTQTSMLAMTRDWYGTEVRSILAAVSHPLRQGGVGVAWHRYGLGDLWTENQFALAGGWGWTLRRFDSRVALGGSLKGLQIAAPGYAGADYQGDFTTWATDLALSVDATSYLRAAWVVENLAAGEMTLLKGGTRQRAAPLKNRGGVSFLWRNDLILGLEYQQTRDRDAVFSFGAEISFFGAFRVRGGAGEHSTSAGFGLTGGSWRLDGAFESRDKLGSSLIFAFNYYLGQAGG